MLPGIDGLEVCRRLREHWPIPVVMLTALGDETDRLAGFEIGADDYVTKPFSPRELAMRVKLGAPPLAQRRAGRPAGRPGAGSRIRGSSPTGTCSSTWPRTRSGSAGSSCS